MLDHVEAFFWSLAYVIAIIYAVKTKKNLGYGVPLISIILNFAWEINSLSIDFQNGLSERSWIRISWLFLDFIIYALALYYTPLRKKLILIFGLCAAIPCFFFIFSIRQDDYMMLSSFVIDLTMAIAYLFFLFSRGFIVNEISVSLGIAKLLGDYFAWQYYKQFYSLIDKIGIVCFICDFLFLFFIGYMFFKQKKKERKKKGSSRKVGG